MARGKINKSQAIRELLNQNPKLSAKAVVEQLAQKRIRVNTSLVYMVKGRLTQIKVHRTRKAERVARAGQKIGMVDPIALVVKVKALAKEAGGIDNLKTLVSVLAD